MTRRRPRRQAWRGRGHWGRGASAAGWPLARAPAWPSECQPAFAVFVWGCGPKAGLSPSSTPAHLHLKNPVCSLTTPPPQERQPDRPSGRRQAAEFRDSHQPRGRARSAGAAGAPEGDAREPDAAAGDHAGNGGWGPRACVCAWCGVLVRVRGCSWRLWLVARVWLVACMHGRAGWLPCGA